jgi:hypothetical protein
MFISGQTRDRYGQEQEGTKARARGEPEASPAGLVIICNMITGHLLVGQEERSIKRIARSISSPFSLAVCRFQSLVDGEGETRFKRTQRVEDQRPSLLQSGEAAGRQSAKSKEPTGSFTMEDLLHFNESDPLFIAHGCLTPKMALAWKHQRLAVRHHFREGTPLQPEGRLRRIV